MIYDLTNDKGEFHLGQIARGTHDVFVRRIGFAQSALRVTFVDKQTVTMTVYLDRVVVLDSVNVNAKIGAEISCSRPSTSTRPAGSERFTPAPISTRPGHPLPGVMAQSLGTHIIYGQSGKAWIKGRGPMRTPMCTPPGPRANPSSKEFLAAALCFSQAGWYLPDPHERDSGMQLGCYARVYLDRLLMNSWLSRLTWERSIHRESKRSSGSRQKPTRRRSTRAGRRAA